MGASGRDPITPGDGRVREPLRVELLHRKLRCWRADPSVADALRPAAERGAGDARAAGGVPGARVGETDGDRAGGGNQAGRGAADGRRGRGSAAAGEGVGGGGEAGHGGGR